MGFADLDNYSNSLVKDSLKSSLYHAASVNADEYAATQAFGKKHNIPTSLVPSDKTKRNEIALQTANANLHETHPKTAAWLSKYENAAVSHDDIDNLKGIEDGARVLLGVPAQMFGMIPAGLHGLYKTVKTLATGGSLDEGLAEGTKAIESTSDLFTHKPTTEIGQAVQRKVGAVMGAPAVASRFLTEGLINTEDYPNVGAAFDTALQALPILAGGRTGIKSMSGLDFMEKVTEAAKASKVLKRSPEQFKEAVAAATDTVEPLTMPVEKFDALLGKHKLKVEQVLTDPSDYHEAKGGGGGSVEIPIADFAANLAEHVAPEDLKDLRVGLTDSVNEAEASKVAAEKAEAEKVVTPPVELKPAVATDTGLKVAETGQRHTDIVPDTPEETRGFTLDGETMLSREESAAWLKENHPDTYEKLPEDQKQALHSEGLWESQGIEVPTERDELPEAKAQETAASTPTPGLTRAPALSRSARLEATSGVWMKDGHIIKLQSPDAYAEYYKPGRLIRTDDIRTFYPDDKVLAFTEPIGLDKWSVQVQGVGRNGSLGSPRVHSTNPTVNELVHVLSNEGWTLHKNKTEAKAAAKASAKEPQKKQSEAPAKSDELPAGPGAQKAGTKETPPDITQLRMTIPSSKPEKPGVIGQTIADGFDTIGLIKDKTKDAFEALKDIGQKIWKGYSKEKEWTDFDDLLGEYMLAKQQSGMAVADFVKAIQDSVSPRVQEAITNWIEAGGDSDIIAERAKAPGKHQQGYVDAMHLDEDSIRLADNIRSYSDSRLAQAQEKGVVNEGVENYVHRIWDRTSKLGKRISSEANSGMLQANPKLARQRVFQSFFEGEQLGYKPKDKRIGYSLASYDLSLNEAIATRNFIGSMRDGAASDGRPLLAVAGSGKEVIGHEYVVGKPGEKGKAYKTRTEAERNKKPGSVIVEREKDSFIVKPKSKGVETGDYRVIDHPALRSWKWVGSVEGKNVLMQGDFMVHPEVYRHLSNVLNESKVRTFEIGGYHPGAIALAASQELKSTLLAASFFHQGQEALHAAGHKVSPWGGATIDLTNPDQAALVKHELMAYSANAMAEFSDGLHASGLVAKIPGVGRYAVQYGNYLFGKYIPELKMQMALHALERNRERYSGKLNEDQILRLTARQANAAFGELNYTAMGRSKTIQDLMRLAVLAPDFLEARVKFVGQALRPHGKEQLTALIRLTVGLTLTAQLTNILVNGEPDWKHPFSVKIGDKQYTLPSVPGDIIHFVTDPRGFGYNRLSPSFAKPVLEAFTGRNSMGRRIELGTRLHEWLIAQAPIPTQEYLKGHDTTFTDSVLKLFGTRIQKKR